jgi:hypothetical protein
MTRVANGDSEVNFEEQHAQSTTCTVPSFSREILFGKT